ncbi:MAG: hypothetical protein Q3972_02180, partial [Corynebacterium sp.]|nr:hypothetical protein [Corynebacterium sp.]
MPLASKIAKAQATLADAGVASPLVDAELIAAHILGVDRLSLRFADDFSPSQQQLFDAALHRRASREPLQHILGTAPFGPLDLRVGPGVFIPRPETEILADWASTFAFAELLRRAKAHSAQQNVTPYRIVDLCSGSGAIACFVFDALATKIASLPAVLAQQLPPVEIVAVELSPEALTYTQANAEQVRAQHQDSAQQDS